ncbi:hypothetical protein [Legionella sainthelensi]|nr:hypothetical protein [Legionella sainthelensi]
MPKSVVSLMLGSNGLGKKSSGELVAILNELPNNLSSLDLRRNNLRDKNSSEWLEIFNALPKTLSSVDLSGNFSKKSNEELMILLNVLPNHVSSLNLSASFLGDKTEEQLVNIIKALPSTVTSLNLSENNLNSITFAKILNALSPSVSSLDLSGNEFVKKTSNELINFFISLPSRIHNIQLDDSLFNVDDFLLAQSGSSAATQRAVERLLTAIQQPLTDENCSFAEILYTDFSSFPIEIDARKKALIIIELLAQNTPWALVAAALIQQERIPVFYEEDAIPVEQSNAHAEICAFSAISYYIQALHHPDADDHNKTFCWGRLWHMQHEYPEGSVFTTVNDFIRNNSSSAELYLTKLFPNYNAMRHNFDKHQEEVKTEPMLQITEPSLLKRFFYHKDEKPAPCEQALKKFEKFSAPGTA